MAAYIKVFSGGGQKFTEELERDVEAIVHRDDWAVPDSAEARIDRLDIIDPYIAHLRRALPDAGRLGRLRVGVDMANGATTSVAPRLFAELGFDVRALGASPDGRNINLDCGSTHPEALARVVREEGRSLGIAFDGDGDRAIFVDGDGRAGQQLSELAQLGPGLCVVYPLTGIEHRAFRLHEYLSHLAHGQRIRC